MNRWREVERWQIGHPDGHSEELIGKSFKDNPSEIVIFTFNST